MRAPHLAGDRRADGVVTVVADPAVLALPAVDAVEPSGEPVDEMLARLFAVGDRIDSGPQLFEYRDPYGVALRFRQIGAFETPTREDALGLGEPGRFR